MALHVSNPDFFNKSAALAAVLITRPEPGASQTARRVAALGFTPLIAPVLSIQSSGPTPRLPRDVAATLLTSRNAVVGCPPTCHELPAFSVGDATAACAVKAGFTRVLSAEGDAVALAALVADRLAPDSGSLFLPTRRGEGLHLAGLLSQKGFRVLRHIVYQAAPVQALPVAAERELRAGHVQTAMFFSTQTARYFVHLLHRANLANAVHDIEAVSISEGSAMALRPLTWRRISVAAKPNQDAMLALLK